MFGTTLLAFSLFFSFLSAFLFFLLCLFFFFFFVLSFLLFFLCFHSFAVHFFSLSVQRPSNTASSCLPPSFIFFCIHSHAWTSCLFHALTLVFYLSLEMTPLLRAVFSSIWSRIAPSPRSPTTSFCSTFSSRCPNRGA